MLLQLLKQYRSEILAGSDLRTRQLSGAREDSDQLRLGLPLFYDQLVHILGAKFTGYASEEILAAAAAHGKELLRLGYSLSHVVHAYGAMCQSITDFAVMKNARISASDFNVLNGCLDVAIASAVSEFQFRSNEETEAREVKHLGFLAHELRNALSSAMVAHQMIKAGLVGVDGSTASVLEANLVRMSHLIDRSLSEVRLRADFDLLIETFRLSDLFDQILVTARIDAGRRKQQIALACDSSIELSSDRQLLLSAVSNLIQNAIKYSKPGALVSVNASVHSDRVSIEVVDECGGIETQKLESLFLPFEQEAPDRSGLGLGLTITRRAITLCGGSISVRNAPGVGCAFVIDLPLILVPAPSSKNAVPGKDAVQPKLG